MTRIVKILTFSLMSYNLLLYKELAYMLIHYTFYDIEGLTNIQNRNFSIKLKR